MKTRKVFYIPPDMEHKFEQIRKEHDIPSETAMIEIAVWYFMSRNQDERWDIIDSYQKRNRKKNAGE